MKIFKGGSKGISILEDRAHVLARQERRSDDEEEDLPPPKERKARHFQYVCKKEL